MMRIHRVSPGDSLWKISQQYGSSPQTIAALNGLPGDNAVVPGLNLLIPATTPVLPGAAKGKRTIEVNGYLIPSGASDALTIRRVAPQLTYLSLFSYQVTAEGGITPQNDAVALATAKQNNILPLMTVTNFDGTNFNSTLAHTILSNNTLRSRFITNLLNFATTKGYSGVTIDFEHLLPSDRPLYNNFIRTLSSELKPRGLSLSLALGPKTSDSPNAPWMGAFDYRALGLAVDFLMLMTYEWGWVGGPPMAIAPLDQVEAVLNYATSVIDPTKILMGMALYGYDWPLPHPQAGQASGLSNNQAQNLAISKGATVKWNSAGASPYFTYATGGRAHEVWYEDPASYAAKLELIYKYNLRGASYWVLGNNFPQNWSMLQDSFIIRKG